MGMKEVVNGVSRYNLYINGEWISTSGEMIEVENPATEEVFATVADATEDEVQRALETAQAAQPAWAQLPAVQRGEWLQKLANGVKKHKETLAQTLTAEIGKPIAQARGEVDASVRRLEYVAGLCRHIEGDILPGENPSENIYIHSVPYGVTVGITAWNFPIAIAARKIGPALVAGNTMVVKPTTLTPASTMEFAQIVDEVGLPPGVINVISGRGRTTGEQLVSNPITKLVSLTGSVRAGTDLMHAAAENITVLRLELGGKAPFVVLNDADVEKAVGAAMISRFANCGQVCTCNERMYIQSGVYDQVVEGILDRVGKMKVGDPLTEVDMGPKVSRQERDRVHECVTSAVSSGAEVLAGGGPLTDGEFSKGHWFAPTVVSNVNHSMDLMREETFGPVLPIVKFDEVEEGFEMANDTRYGLSAYVFSNNMRQIQEVIRDCKFGEIYVNRQLGESPQGFHTGHGISGMGGEDGKYGLDGFLQKRTVYLNFS